MSLSELHIRSEVAKLTESQLLDIKAHGYDSEEFKTLEKMSDFKYYRGSILSFVGTRLLDEDLIGLNLEFDLWWEHYTG